MSAPLPDDPPEETGPQQPDVESPRAAQKARPGQEDERRGRQNGHEDPDGADRQKDEPQTDEDPSQDQVAVGVELVSYARQIGLLSLRLRQVRHIVEVPEHGVPVPFTIG